MNERTRIVACAHVSNALGTVLPVREITQLAHARGAVVLIDGAQAVPHQRVDLKALDCDFYAFSAHKMYGPTGIGALIGRESLLEAMPPWQGGGDMILTVSFEKTTFNVLPFKFEAGTPNISGAVGMAAAIDYIDSLGIDRIHAHEQRLLELATRKLEAVPGLTIIGTAPDKAAVISFTLDGIHPHDLGTILDAEGVAVRTGHHCAMPVMEFFGRARDGARVVRLLFARVRHRRAGRRARPGRARCSADGPQGPLSRRDPRSQQDARACSAGSSPPTPRPTATIPLCGDRLHVTLRLDGDRVSDLRFDGKGCAISVASASLMCEAVKGKRRSEIAHLFNEMHEVLTKHDAPVPEDLGKLAALSGVREFPVRVKCASLCWHTLNAALERSHEPVKTE